MFQPPRLPLAVKAPASPDAAAGVAPQAASDVALARLRHELRGPLTALMCAVEVLEAGARADDPPQTAEAREIIRRQARRLAERLDATELEHGAAQADAPQPLLLLALRDRAAAARLGCALARRGVRVRTEVDGLEALHALHEIAPTLALVEGDLPGLDGWALARQARAAGHTGRLLALVGAQGCDLPGLRAAGFDGWLVKPPAGADSPDLPAQLEQQLLRC